MTLSLAWHVSPVSSALYLGWAGRRGQQTRDDLVQEAVTRWEESVTGAANSHVDRRWLDEVTFAAIAATALSANSQSAAEKILRRCGNERLTSSDQIAVGIDSLQSDLEAIRPRWLAELETRRRPIQMQWEARGPGLWRAYHREHGHDRNTPIPPQAIDVVLVEPVLHGHAFRLPGADTVVMEGVLTNIDDQIPEVLRLLWTLVTPTTFDEGRGRRVTEEISRQAVQRVLQVAEQLELLSDHNSKFELATRMWCRNLPDFGNV